MSGYAKQNEDTPANTPRVVKEGWWTTELWFAAVVTAACLAYLVGLVDDPRGDKIWSLMAMAACSGAYSLSRGIVKLM